jgi:hypothetical protein
MPGVVRLVDQATGFFRGVFIPGELEVFALHNKASRLGFTTALVEYVSLARGSPVGCNPRHVIAGRDSYLTNYLLQEVARLAQSPAVGAMQGILLARFKSGHRASIYPTHLRPPQPPPVNSELKSMQDHLMSWTTPLDPLLAELRAGLPNAVRVGGECP